MDPLEAAALLVLFTFLPPLLFLWRLRNAERSGREPWGRLLVAFLWGALAAVLIAVVGEQYVLGRYALEPDTLVTLPWVGAVPALAVVVAPVVEEAGKGLGLLILRDRRPEPENGIVYGGAVGLGFAATENLLYVGAALFLQGADVAIVTGIFRGLATVALHGSATALVGYGAWRLRFGPRRWRGLILFPLGLALAVLVHATYNAIASIELAAFVALAFALLMFGWTRARVRRVERRGA